MLFQLFTAKNEIKLQISQLWTKKLYEHELTFGKEPYIERVWILEAGNYTLLISYSNSSTLDVWSLEQEKLVKRFNLELLFPEEVVLIQVFCV